MKRFFYYAIIFIIPLLLFLCSGEYVIRQQPNPHKFKHRWMLQHADEVETLFLGSSHAYYGIKPELVNGAFNLALPSQKFEYDYRLLTHYESSYNHLKRVLLPISYFSFRTIDWQDGSEWWLAINYKIYMDIDKYSDYSRYNWEISHLSVYTKKLLAMCKTSSLQCSNLGQGLEYSLKNKSSDWEQTGMEAAKRHSTELKNNYFTTNLNYLNKIIEFCKQRNIELVLYTTPTWHLYYENLDSVQLAEMYHVVDSICKKHNIAYYDYLKDNRFNEDDFYDCDHLSSDVGAVKFTEILKKEVLTKSNLY